MSEGADDGIDEGDSDGFEVGMSEGADDGIDDGDSDGFDDGELLVDGAVDSEGTDDGSNDGASVLAHFEFGQLGD